MALPTPNLDDRTFEQIRDEAVRLIPQYCPEWTNYNPSDPGITLIELFSWMTEMVLYRLNKVPEKVYLTLLDLIGVRLRAPQPARTMLTLHLVEGYTGGTWVPRGTQIATEPNEEGDSIVFETEEDLYVVSNQLQRIISIHRDKVADNTDLLKEVPRVSFDAFAGTKEIDRFVYLCDSRFGTLAENGTVQVVFDCPKAKTEGLTALLEWEYWNGHRWRDLDTVEIPPEEVAASTKTQKAVGFLGPLEDIAVGEVAGEEGFWLRGHLIELPLTDDETVVGGVNAAAQIMDEGVLPDVALACAAEELYVPLDMTKTFYPFGENPQLDSCFYLNSSECLGKDDARVFLDFTTADPKIVPPANPTPNLVLQWEYWNGTRWAPIGRTTKDGAPDGQSHDFRDGTNAFQATGAVSFLVPKDMQPLDVNGSEGDWVRCRVEMGNYGKAGGYEVVEGNWVWKDDHPLAPPAFRGLMCRYSQVAYPVEKFFTYNDFNYVDRSDLVRDQFKSFQAFEPFREEHPAMYLGFEGAFPPGQPVKVFFRVEEIEEDKTDLVLEEPFAEEASEREKRRKRRKGNQRVIWEYWDGERWADLLPRDRTINLTRSGLLEFRAPAEHLAKREFGEDLHWIRCRLEMGSYARSPKIQDVLPNSVSSVNAIEIKNETLGHSDGTPDQRFTFNRFPVLPGQSVVVREHDMPGKRELKQLMDEEGEEALKIVTDEAGSPTEVWTRWHQVDSFYASSSTSRHYRIDPVEGMVVFGDGRRGMIPPPGQNAIVVESYMTGGGLVGNVGAGSLVVLRQAIPYVERVTNYYKARGGADLETLDEAKMRGPQVIRHRWRAVTTEDYEWLALRASGNVARARCLKTPKREGEVTLIVLPEAEQRDRDLHKKPVPAPELLRRVKDFLDERRLVTTRLRVVKPRYVELSVRVSVVLKEGGPAVDRIKQTLESAIRTALHPLFGGTDGKGWPFGRAVHKSDLYRVVEGMEGVDFVEDLTLYDEDLKRSTVQLALQEDELVHVVNVEVREVVKETVH
ncbi:putative baseplate assembly protein [Planctomycetota bacterium]|nr:putative baseplate assembly protein [Planctomycetota bacterium]